MDKKRSNIVVNVTKSTYEKATNKITDKISEAALELGIGFIRDHIGIVMHFDSDYFNALKYVRKWLIIKDKKKYYKNAKNVYTMNNLNNNKIDDFNLPLLVDDSKYIIKLDNATYCAVLNKYIKRDNDNGNLNIITLFMFGRKYKKYARELRSYVNKYEQKNNGDQFILRVVKRYADYGITGYIAKRYFDSIFMNKEQKDELIKYINKWKLNSKLFTERGINHKTGILLYGEPGTGKTSIARAIAAELNANITSIDMNIILDANLDNIFRNQDQTLVVLLEDIDCIVGHRDTDIMTDTEKAALNKTLQMLDGVNNANNIIFVATTNHFEQLDPALIRAGRFDIQMEIGSLDRNLAIDMCKSFKIEPSILPENMTSINPSKLQNMIIKHLLEVSNI